MKAFARILISRAVLAVMLLVMLQTRVAAQDESDTATIIIDSSAYPPNDVTQEEDDMQVESEPVAPVFRKVPDSTIKRLQRLKEFEYANDPAYWVKEKPEEIERQTWLEWLFTRPWMKYVLISLLAAILLYAMVRIIISSNVVMFRRAPAAATKFEEQDLLQRDNLPQLIAQAEQAGDFRSAVRYRYTKALQDLDRKKLIQLNARSTNWDYVNKLGGHPLKKQFLLLTRAFEYVWYGEFAINGEQYGYVKTEFQKFENSL